jgi:MATE family multidrug resistance protein
MKNLNDNGSLVPGGYRELWLIAYPLIITNAAHTVMQFVDRKFLSINSTGDIAAALPGGILAFTLFTFFIVTTGFTAAVVSQYHGRKNYKKCAAVPWTGFYFAIFAGLLCSYALIYPGEWCINSGHHTPDILGKERGYFRMLMPGGGFIFISTAFSAFFSGRGKTWTVAIIHLVACCVNIFLDYIFIFGNFGAPAMGIEGAGFATTLSCVVGAGIAFAFFISQNQTLFSTRAKTSFSFNFEDMKRLFLFGAPAGVEILFSVSAFTYLIFLIGSIGSSELAATTIALSINMITFMPLLGISEATGIITGRYVGKGMKSVAEHSAYRGWKLATAYMLFTGTCYLLFPDILIRFFKPDTPGGNIDFMNVMKSGRIILLCAAFYNLFNAFRFIFMGALRGAGDTKIPMWIIVACSWGILAPGGYILIPVLNVSIVKVWTFLTAYSALVGLFIFLRFKSGKWKSIEMTKELPESPMQPPLLDAMDPE